MKFKSFYLICIILILSTSNILSQVKIKSVYASNELSGVFCKTTLEITFYNPSPSDSLEGVFNFKTLDNAFIKDMWLEIDGKFNKAENLDIRTAQRIYDRIVGAKIDPALLKKGTNGRYSLNVFPVNSKKERVVRIEMYSVLVGNKKNIAHWFLEFDPRIEKYLEINYSLPKQSYINYGKYFSNKQFLNNPEVLLIDGSIKKTQVDELSFTVYLGADKFIVQNEEQIFMTELKSNNIFSINNNSDFLNNLDQIIVLLKNKDSVFVQHKNQNIFANKFMKYLSKHLNLYQIEKEKSFGWFKNNDKWNFIQANYYLTQINNRNKSESQINIHCPYLLNFIDYNNALSNDENAKINSAFLFNDLAKLVIEENDKRAVEIREQELLNEINANEFDEEFPVEFFVAVERMPEPIGGIQSIQNKIYYPQKFVNAKVEGRVYVKALVDTTGFVINTEIIKGIANELDTIAMRAVQTTRFLPGKQRNKKIRVQISIPIVFRIGETRVGKPSENAIIDEVEVENKKFNIILFDNNEWRFYQNSFKVNKSKNLEYLSEKSFSFLMQNPDQIKYILIALEDYSFDAIGLVINGESLLFTPN